MQNTSKQPNKEIVPIIDFIIGTGGTIIVVYLLYLIAITVY